MSANRSCPLRIALLGNPNGGKTTLFNVLTGARQKVGNWAGVTVEMKSGTFVDGMQTVELIDLPGIYTLTTGPELRTCDETITTDFLAAQAYSIVINVVDALNLERHLYLTLQCLEKGLPLIVVLNRIDLAQQAGKQIDVLKLQERLGCPVIPIVARSGQGLPALKQVLHSKIISDSKKINYESIVEEQITSLQAANPILRAHCVAWLEGEIPPYGIASKIQKAQRIIFDQTQQFADVLIAKGRFDWIEAVLDEVQKKQPVPVWGRGYLDYWICHRILGVPLFLLAMYVLFCFSTYIGGFFQEYFEQAAEIVLVQGLDKLLLGLSAPVWLSKVLISASRGVVAVLTFVPVIGSMFFALAFLEDSGYMARAAFIIDRVMQSMGLPGKSFVPMIVGFGCNVPAIMGARILENKRDRILAVMMSPFMSCGARLAIFTVFVSAFFPRTGHNIIFLFYVLGIAMAVLTGLLLKKTVLKAQNSPLLLEMPTYQWPHWPSLVLHAWHKLKRFVFNSAKLIVPVCLVLGLLNQVNLKGEWLSADNVQGSILAVGGKKIVPLFKPMGLEEDNWPAVVGLLTGVLAKEVVIGSLQALYGVTDEASEGALIRHFKDKTHVIAYLLFILLYFPCVSATAAMVKEVQKRWAVFSLFWTTGLAYAVAVLYFQIATFERHPLISSIWIGGIVVAVLMVGVALQAYQRRFIPAAFPTPIVLVS